MSYLTLAQFKTRTIMPREDVEALTRLPWVKRDADADASTASVEAPIGNVLVTGDVMAVVLTPRGTLVSDNANYATLSVYRRTSGGARVLVAAATTQGAGTGSWSPGVALSVPIVASSVLEDDQLTVSITKAGAGVVVPAFDLYVASSPTFVDAKLIEYTSKIDARLKKRYAVPFVAPIPEIVCGWLERLVTRECYLRRGFNPSSAQDSEIIERAKGADAEIKESADEKDGLFDLPLREDLEASSAIVRGPMGSAESSPYAWTDVQAEAVRFDGGRRGPP